MHTNNRAASRGRPRAFDPDSALDRALHVFWHKGYEGTSLADLTRAMRINRPSLYAAFGNKEALFRKALDRYTDGPASYAKVALAAPTARKVAEGILFGVIDLITDPRYPSGCLIVQSALTCGDECEPIRKELLARRLAYEQKLKRRLERARSQGDLPKKANPTELARYLCTFIRGLCVHATDGASRQELRRVAEMALRSWPK